MLESNCSALPEMADQVVDPCAIEPSHNVDASKAIFSARCSDSEWRRFSSVTSCFRVIQNVQRLAVKRTSSTDCLKVKKIEANTPSEMALVHSVVTRCAWRRVRVTTESTAYTTFCTANSNRTFRNLCSCFQAHPCNQSFLELVRQQSACKISLFARLTGTATGERRKVARVNTVRLHNSRLPGSSLAFFRQAQNSSQW